MAAAQTNLSIEQGATFTMALNFNQPNNPDGSQGDPIDVSGWTFKGSIRASYTSPTDLQDFSFDEGLTTNQIIVSISADDTALLPVLPVQNYSLNPSGLAFDIFASVGGGTVLKIMQGEAQITPRVTL